MFAPLKILGIVCEAYEKIDQTLELTNLATTKRILCEEQITLKCIHTNNPIAFFINVYRFIALIISSY